MPDQLTERLREFVQRENIHANPYFKIYGSGVHGVVDCVFSAQARYGTVVRALGRLENRLPDLPTLTFTEFLDDVQTLGSDQYAASVLTHQQLARRLKVDVACDVARFFVTAGIETKADLHARYPLKAVAQQGAEAAALERLILTEKPVLVSRYCRLSAPLPAKWASRLQDWRMPCGNTNERAESRWSGSHRYDD